MIRSSRTDAVVTIELDRAEKRNALNEEMLSGLSDAFSAAVDGDARAIVLTGRGPVFSAGADLTGPVYDLGFLDGVMTLMEKIESVPVPVIAAVSGGAIGAGLQLAMAADLRVLTPGTLVAIPAAKLGVSVDEWTIRRLVTLVGAGQARNLLIGCETLSAERGLELGFTNRIGDLAAAQAWAAEIAELAPLTLQHYKMVLNAEAREKPAPERVEAMERCWISEDIEEGRAARAAKRKPVFKGR
ncbi:enoyl-CoA hydratase [Gordonia sp. (in: high G+C Gram-positive bacteria)]|jgi:enoyl-CoA hydratase|uniref:enoyl-CoA hydratase n=1 Tax=Gordonia sp. (in: high G+C Gram-positive bacteria) TaxID=84139 RepID=UPI001DF2ED89|nr:enoyl-CoA hydratase [Gordonia sp. (in: high G+C Gram-positive bacteria)]MCB1295514.1 enoyl-CoA hydratase [Gordonia sp. (in: high G+C Gram-positive bacteria)]HMS74601.1 enoyl-CoA hydratase [Gordonia sp. (in: high G+C Gram-positive bacteria)]